MCLPGMYTPRAFGLETRWHASVFHDAGGLEHGRHTSRKNNKRPNVSCARPHATRTAAFSVLSSNRSLLHTRARRGRASLRDESGRHTAMQRLTPCRKLGIDPKGCTYILRCVRAYASSLASPPSNDYRATPTAMPCGVCTCACCKCIFPQHLPSTWYPAAGARQMGALKQSRR